MPGNWPTRSPDSTTSDSGRKRCWPCAVTSIVTAGCTPDSAPGTTTTTGRKPRWKSNGNYDGVGRLTEVTPAKFGAPRYALLDKSGDVRCYVTPAPGVNLQRYVGQKVGVTGNRGYMIEEHASHIMARHVTPLEGAMLR